VSETRKFTEDIMQAAKEKARIITEEAETETRTALDEAKANSAREAEEILSTARAEAESVKRRQLSDIRHRTKLQEQSEKSKILTEVMDQTKRRVTEILKQQTAYLPFLSGLTVGAIREIELQSVVIHMNEVDLKRVDITGLEGEIRKTLSKPVQVELSREPIQALGGVVVSSKDGKTRIVSTLDQRFEALEPKLLIEAGKTLFGE
jgi:V/A-type H+-transporting ATPase subunit E